MNPDTTLPATLLLLGATVLAGAVLATLRSWATSAATVNHTGAITTVTAALAAVVVALLVITGLYAHATGRTLKA